MWVVVVVLLLLILVPGVLIMGWGTGMMGGGTRTGNWWIAGAFLLVVAIIGILAVLFFAPRGTASPPQPPYPGYAPATQAPPAAMTPSQILDARYARGEITRDEYFLMRKDLEQK